MNITFQYDIKNIDSCNCLPITFDNGNGLKHYDAVRVSRDSNGNIDESALTVAIDELFQRVIAKKDNINWIQV